MDTKKAILEFSDKHILKVLARLNDRRFVLFPKLRARMLARHYAKMRKVLGE